MKLAILSLLAGSAAAFAPASTGRVASSLDATRAVKKEPAPKKSRSSPAAPEGLVGALPPVGFFDPAGFAAKASDEELARYREVEIMHGRFAQLAFLGFVIPEKCAYDGAFGDDFLAPTGRALEVFSTDPLWLGLTLGIISALEAVRLLETTPGNRVDARIESIGWRPKSDAEFVNYQVRELQNGRLAMLAVAGEIVQELVNDKPLLVNLQDSNFVSF